MGIFPAWYCEQHGRYVQSECGVLRCLGGHEYLTINGIPRFVKASNYADHFGLQWNRYRTTQLDSHTGVPISSNRLKRCLGEVWDSLSGKQVLECGCGAGRFTEILLQKGSFVTSVDLSLAVEANAQNCPITDRHRVAQADILALPFRPRQFDLVLCLGVVQHTPNPEITIARLFDHVAPGGFLVLDHYAFTLAWYTKTAPLLRIWLKRCSPRFSLRVTERLVDSLLPIHKATSDVPGLRSVICRISPILSYYQVFPELNDCLQHEWALLDTHDYLTDWYKHFRTPKRIKSTLAQLGIEDISCECVCGVVEVRGRRPCS